MKIKSLISKLLILFFCFSIILTISNNKSAFADSYISVTLGADLTDAQKEQMLSYFKVTKNDANVIEITSAEEYEALGKIASASQLGTKAISCSYVEPTSSGGLDVQTNNLTWVTNDMIKNALVTAGIENAKIIAAAPFKVSGTAALTGILKGFEKSSSGSEISDDKKEVANDELYVTGDVGDQIGQDEAANIINDIKKEVIKEKPKTDDDVDKIVDDVLNEYNYKLNEDTINKIKELMKKINDLDLNYSSLKNQLNSISDKLKDKVDTADMKGFFDKVCDFFSSMWQKLKSLFN